MPVKEQGKEIYMKKAEENASKKGYIKFCMEIWKGIASKRVGGRNLHGKAGRNCQ